MSKKIDEQMVPLSAVTKLVEEASVKTADRLMAAIGVDDSMGTKHLSTESERMMTEQGEPEEAREKLRKMLDELPVEAQDTWLRTYYSSREYAKGEPDLKVRAEEYAARTAWDSVKRKFTKDGDAWKQIGAAVTFDTISGKWVVTHSSLAQPMEFSDQKDAEALFSLVTAKEKPFVNWNGNKQAYEVTHRSWEDPVVAKTLDDAVGIAARKMKDEGWSDTEITAETQKLIESAKKEAVMAATYVDKGATPKGDQLHSDHSSIPEPKVAGTTTVETPHDTIPKSTGKGAMQFKHTESAAGFDKLVEQLARSKGLIKEASEVAGIDVDAAVLVWRTGLTVEADAKQNVKGGPSKDLVSGVGAPTDKISQPREGHPKVPGYVNTEGLAMDTLPKSDLSQSIEFKHKDGAAKFDRLVDQLKKQKGLTTEMQKLASEQGVDVASTAWKRGAKALKKKYSKGKKGFDRSACVADLTAAGIQNAEAFANWLSNVEE